MSDFLSAMAASSRLRAEEVRGRLSEADLTSKVSSARPPARLELSDEGFDLIAEAKLASPSEGRLAAGDDDTATVVELASALAASGAAAISILTEPSRFDGNIGHLEMVTSELDLPVMRKDFLVDTVQVLESRAAGASGVLLIARLSEASVLVEMTDLALSLGMFVLVEVFEEADLDVASAVFDREILVGVNARDLATLDVDVERHRKLSFLLPDHLPLVAESGVLDGSDAADVALMGYRLALVGSSLVSSRDPAGLAAEMIGAGRGAVGVKEGL